LGIEKKACRCRLTIFQFLPVAYSNGFMLIKFDMKQYVIDGFSLQDYHTLKEYFDMHLEAASVDGIYWFELERDVLTPVQSDHESCRPHVFALMLENTYLSCELLVRIKTNIKCDCMGYATKEQRDWLIDQTDAIFETLSICI